MGRFRTLTRLGCVNRTAHQVNEEAYEMLDLIVGQKMRKPPSVNRGSTIEMWKLRKQAKTVAEETILMDIVYQYH